MEYMNLVNDCFPRVVALRRQLHAHPELAFREVHTSQLIADCLSECGWDIRKPIAHTGLAATRGQQDHPVLAIRADMDALPQQDRKTVPYASQHPGVMHACGHDGHVAMLLGTAMVLTQLGCSLPGAIKLIFQPAEEGPGGAELMIQDGVLTAPLVSHIIGFHLTNALPTGSVGLHDGLACASTDEIILTVYGQGGHGGYPHQANDAIVIACQLVTALQTVVSRRVNPLQPVVLSFGTIHGGNANNIIADKVELRGTIRVHDNRLRHDIVTLIQQISQGVCSGMNGHADLTVIPGYPPLVNDRDTTTLARSAAEQVCGPDRVLLLQPTMGGEDFAYFAQACPSTFIRIGSGNQAKNCLFPGHHPEFDFDEDALKTGMAVLIQTVLNYFAMH